MPVEQKLKRITSCKIRFYQNGVTIETIAKSLKISTNNVEEIIEKFKKNKAPFQCPPPKIIFLA